LPDLNWAGFYLLKQGELVVGPFQGKPACVRIAVGKGVCGTAAQERKAVIVRDVHAFPGHIACDSASNSEIVVPMIRRSELLGVLDLDSPKLERFDETDRDGLERFVAILIGEPRTVVSGQ
jgi:L-methionine (R)-S-oxide reductase